MAVDAVSRELFPKNPVLPAKGLSSRDLAFKGFIAHYALYSFLLAGNSWQATRMISECKFRVARLGGRPNDSLVEARRRHGAGAWACKLRRQPHDI
jgi:hypothetical protein